MSARARHRKSSRVHPLIVVGVPASLAVAAVVVPVLPGSPASASVTTPGRAPSSGLMATPAVRTAAGTQAVTSYTVREGDTLSSIAQRFYGSAAQWPALWFVNKITDPNVIETGQRLRIDLAVTDTAAILRGAQRAIPAPPPAPAAAPVQQAAPAAPVSTVADTVSGNVNPAGYSGFQECVVTRESGGNPNVMNSSGHYGLYQFSFSTWVGYGGSPSSFGHASVAEQNAVFAAAMASPGGEDNWAPYDGC